MSLIILLKTYKQRQAERDQAAQMRAQSQAAKTAEQARKAYERAQKADQKEQARLYTEARLAEVSLQNEQLEQQVHQLSSLLTDALAIDTFIDFGTMRQTPQIPLFNPGPLGMVEPPPTLQMYLPPALSTLQKMLPGAKEKYAQNVTQAHERYQADIAVYNAREFQRQQALATEKAKFERHVTEIRNQVAAQNAEVERFQKDFACGVPAAIVSYFTIVLASSSYPENFPQHAKAAYVPESKQLVVEYDLPAFESIPVVGSYKYIKTKDTVTETTRPATQRKVLYSSVVAQIALRTLYELFKADRSGFLDIIVFNGYVDAIDKGTGHTTRACLITVRTSRDTFMHLDLSKVDPIACLNVLNASVSKSPDELVPVRPVLEFNMVDPRFIEETDILSELDQRTNLMDLTPSEFEALITNLFQKMGLETRLTRASRDGGVDCVAYDPRPIFGGKVVIQAKLYKDTVGVSAVRDLFGTVMNEGASKGILVTTSGFGKASFEFAEGKPLELLSGSNLLALLADYAGIEAKIEMPNN
jgi:restriction system protein